MITEARINGTKFPSYKRYKPLNGDSMETKYEIVYTVNEGYDFPLEGIADFQGLPHSYKYISTDSQGRIDYYNLSPIDDETFQLAVEDWAIWRRWERAFHSRLIGNSPTPALPEDMLRYEQLRVLLAERLKINSARITRAKGNFQPRISSEIIVRGMMPDLEVEWTVIGDQ